MIQTGQDWPGMINTGQDWGGLARNDQRCQEGNKMGQGGMIRAGRTCQDSLGQVKKNKKIEISLTLKL